MKRSSANHHQSANITFCLNLKNKTLFKTNLNSLVEKKIILVADTHSPFVTAEPPLASEALSENKMHFS